MYAPVADPCQGFRGPYRGTGHRPSAFRLVEKKKLFFSKKTLPPKSPRRSPDPVRVPGRIPTDAIFLRFRTKKLLIQKNRKFFGILFFLKNFGILFFGKFRKKSKHFLCPENFWKLFRFCFFLFVFAPQKKKTLSPTGNRTRVWWVRATYPDQLDYRGVLIGTGFEPVPPKRLVP